MRSELDAVVDDFLDAEEIAWAGMDIRTVYESADLFRYDPLLAEEWTELHTVPMMRAVRERHISFKQAALLMHNPSLIRCSMLFDILIAKEARVGTEIYLQVFDFYSSLASSVCPEDPFAKKGTSRIYPPQEVEAMTAMCVPGDERTARELGKLANACYSLSHGLYCDMNPQIVYDNIGPYYGQDGKLFVLKMFHNLKPVEIWPETAALPVGRFDIGMHMQGVTMTMDATSHATYIGSQITGLRDWWCTADGKRVSIEEILPMRKAIEQCAIDVYVQTKKFSIEERKQMFCYQKAFGYKMLFDTLGLDWEPPSQVLAVMRGEYLFDKWDIDPDTGSFRVALRDVLDPRKEIPPAAFK